MPVVPPCSFLAVSTITPVSSPTVHSAILLGAFPIVFPAGRFSTILASTTCGTHDRTLSQPSLKVQVQKCRKDKVASVDAA